MSNVSKISVALTQEMATYIGKAVESGDYATSSEVIRDALREWKPRRTMTGQERLQIQDLWAERLASGPGCFKDMAAIKAEARRLSVG